MKTIQTTIHFYMFDTREEDEAAAYAKLCEAIRATPGRGHEHHVLRCGGPKERMHGLGKHGTSQVVTLETQHLFENQWNCTEIGRVFDWYESVLPEARHRKCGHYLDITPEIIDIRQNTLACGYCGNQMPLADKPADGFCPKCVSSEYLEREQLYLLRLVPVNCSFSHARAPLTDQEMSVLLPRYIEAQSKIEQARTVKIREALLDDYRARIKKAETKKDGFLWLLDNGINTDNAIYYDHVDTFSFGWRHKIDKLVADELRGKLEKFPFKYEIKVA
jgi:hypothetical protein